MNGIIPLGPPLRKGEMKLRNMSKLLSPAKTKVLFLGNEAIARGALEAGVSVACAYPGTPSSEVIESLSGVAQERNMYVEWSVNEKVAVLLPACVRWRS